MLARGGARAPRRRRAPPAGDASYDADDGIAEEQSALNRLAVPLLSLDDEIREHRAYSDYWRLRADNGASDMVVPLPAPAAATRRTAPPRLPIPR